MATYTEWTTKTWKDRVSEYFTRRTLTKTDGTTEVVTVERNEGEVTEAGDSFDADTMNDLEARIDAGFTQSNAVDAKKGLTVVNGKLCITYNV